MIQKLIIQQMIATRAAAQALIQSIDMFKALAASSAPESPVPAPPGPAPMTDEQGVCRHPREYRLPTPTMGNLHRTLCGVCGHEVEVTSDEQPSSKEEG